MLDAVEAPAPRLESQQRIDLKICYGFASDPVPYLFSLHFSAACLLFRIGAVHHVEGRHFDVDISYWCDRSQEARDEIYVKYWALIREMAESRLFDIAAHLELPKKLGFYPTSDLSPHIDAALDAIHASDMVVELNAAGFGKPCADGYPSLQILQKCEERDIPVTLSSDGHIPEHILFSSSEV